MTLICFLVLIWYLVLWRRYEKRKEKIIKLSKESKNKLKVSKKTLKTLGLIALILIVIIIAGFLVYKFFDYFTFINHYKSADSFKGFVNTIINLKTISYVLVAGIGFILILLLIRALRNIKLRLFEEKIKREFENEVGKKTKEFNYAIKKTEIISHNSFIGIIEEYRKIIKLISKQRKRISKKHIKIIKRERKGKVAVRKRELLKKDIRDYESTIRKLEALKNSTEQLNKLYNTKELLALKLRLENDIENLKKRK
jgi:hypothetical protein